MSEQTTMNGTTSDAGKAGELAKPKATAATIEVIPSIKELDAGVEKVRKIKASTAYNHWDLGKAIGDLFETQAWKARVTAEGKQAYTNWSKFCEAELGLSHTQGYKLMDIASTFPREHMATYGSAKLGLVLQAPEEDQPKLLEQAKKTSKRELAAAVKKARKEKGAPEKKRKDNNSGRKNNNVKGSSAKATTKAVAKTGDRIAVVDLIRSAKVSLYKKDHAGDKAFRASKLGELPVGYHDLAVGIRQFFALEETENGIVLKMSIRRVDENGVVVRD